MVSVSRKNRNGKVKTKKISKRLGFMDLNKKKSELLSAVMQKAMILKNNISKYISTNRFRLVHNYNELVADYKLFNKDEYIRLNEKMVCFSAKEVQAIFQDIATAYMYQYQGKIENFSPSIQVGWERTVYKKGKNKGKTKTWDLRKEKTEICKLVEFAVRYPKERWPIILKKSDKHEEVIRKIEKHKHNQKILRLADNIRNCFLLNLKCSVYKTGTHRKYFCANGKDRVCEIVKDDSNSTYKIWLKIFFGKKSDKNVLYLPLATNEKYYETSKINKNNSFLIKEQSCGRFVIILAEDKEFSNFEDLNITFENTLGVDVNGTGRFLATTDHNADQKICTEWLNRKLKILFESEQKINNSINKKINHDVLRRRMNKAILSIEMVIKSKISCMLDTIERNGIKNISIEDLTLFKTKSSFVKIKEFDGIKLSKLIRHIRLSSIGKWIEQQAEKRMLKVHRVPAAYTSQRCNCCGHIDRENRVKKSLFKCVSCGYTSDADYNAAINVKLITVVGVLRTALLKLESTSGCFVPKSNRKEFIRDSYEKAGFYCSLPT